MKTRTWVLTALAFFIVAIGNATDIPKMNVIPLNEEKALLAYESLVESPLEITLSNCNGEVVYYKRSTKRCSEYKKVFDFSEFGKGNYCVCVNYGNQSISRNVSVKTDGMTIGEATQLYEPYFRVCDKKLNVSFFNAAQKEVHLSIYKNGNYINGIDLGNDLTIQRCLDLSKLKHGEYEIVLIDKAKAHKYFAQL